jgi:8-oxo-dGTP pyrophosphatase MutT (NUDIX family)
MERDMKQKKTASNTYKCPYCTFEDVEDELWKHVPKVHGDMPSSTQKCPICLRNGNPFAVHFHDEHGPPSRVKKPVGFNESRPTYTFALVVCRHPDGKFLIVDEPASWGWWLPAGRVDPGESLFTGALRETKEEAGIDVELKGLLKFEYMPHGLGGGRQRIIFYGEPKDPNQPPKSEPDYESRGAKWATFEEIEKLRKDLKLRGSEIYDWAKYLKEGGTIHPLDIIWCTGD